jgi:WXG100 family type VII secretion target
MRGGYRIQANYDELEQVAQQFGTHGDGVSNLLQQVQRTAGDLQNGGWVGTGANAFFAEVSDLISPGLKRLTHSLSEAREAVLLICATFQEAEREASRQFDGSDPGARAVEGGEDEDKTIIAWSKFEPIGEHKLFVRGGEDGRKIHPNDVDQQSLGDCTVMAALATIADKNPELIENAIRPNKDGSYTVTLYELTELPPPKDRIAHEITVTPEFPTASRINPETGDIVSRPKMHAGVGDERAIPATANAVRTAWALPI